MLRAELKKIEARKKEREKKTQDLQKLIAQADSSNNKNAILDKKALKKKLLANGQAKSPMKEQMDTGKNPVAFKFFYYLFLSLLL